MSGNLYEDVERSIREHLVQAMIAKGWAHRDADGVATFDKYPVFNNLVTKRDFSNFHASLSIMKISDVPNLTMGGGTKAVLRTPQNVDPNTGFFTGNLVEDWPDAYDLLYQLEVYADQLQAVRDLDQLIRDVFRPHQPMPLWDSEANAWSTSYCTYAYAGYINRDVPENDTYWRITNVRFEVYNFTDATTVEPVITQVPGLEFDIQNKS